MRTFIKRYSSDAGNVRWKVDSRVEGIRIRKQNFHTKKEAQTYLEKIRLLIISGGYAQYLAEKEEENKTVNDVSFKEYSLQLFNGKKSRDIRNSTKNRYRMALETNLFPVIGSKMLRQITSSDFERIKEIMLSQGYARPTINSPLSALTYVLKRAKEEGRIDTVPRNEVPFKQSKRNIFLTDDEFKRLVRTVDKEFVGKREWFRVFFHLQLNTFTRVGELVALNWTDIDFENKTISINKHYSQSGDELTPTKNGRVHNALPLSDWMVSVLRAYKIKCGFCPIVFPIAHYFSAGKYGSKYKRNMNVPRMSRGGIQRMFKMLASNAGIDPKRLSSHILRKTAGDRLLRSGFSIQQVAHALRIDAKTVLWTYSTLDESAFCEKLKTFTFGISDDMQSSNDNVEDIKKGKSE